MTKIQVNRDIGTLNFDSIYDIRLKSEPTASKRNKVLQEI